LSDYKSIQKKKTREGKRKIEKEKKKKRAKKKRSYKSIWLFDENNQNFGCFLLIDRNYGIILKLFTFFWFLFVLFLII
jgi:hypothetical protein